MARREVRRHKPVKDALDRFWIMLGGLRGQGVAEWEEPLPYPDWLQESSFVTIYLHLCQFVDGEAFFDPEARQMVTPPHSHSLWFLPVLLANACTLHEW